MRYSEFPSTKKDLNIQNAINITQAGLIHFIETYEWNQLVQPVLPRSSKPIDPETIIQFSFIDDINVFASLIISSGLNANELAISLFQSIKYYSVSHLRLWLYGLVENHFFNFTGFRTVFKELTRKEQYQFRERANTIQQNEEREN